MGDSRFFLRLALVAVLAVASVLCCGCSRVPRDRSLPAAMDAGLPDDVTAVESSGLDTFASGPVLLSQELARQ